LPDPDGLQSGQTFFQRISKQNQGLAGETLVAVEFSFDFSSAISYT
jgi:hypothetical protein